MKICSIFFRRKDACRKLKIETVRVFVAQKKKTIDRETTYGENFIFLRNKDTLVGKVSILQPERGIRIK